jgi:hypothetical protein
MNAQPSRSVPPPEEPTASEQAQRLFLFEPGWGVGLKVGSERVFCYMMAPGQDYYHRLLDGELYVYHRDERLCFACAQRRGLLSFEPRALRASQLPLDLIAGLDTDEGEAGAVFKLEYAPGDEDD